MILIVNRQTDTHMATLYCIFSFIRRRSIQQQKYMKKREREKNNQTRMLAINVSIPNLKIARFVQF